VRDFLGYVSGSTGTATILDDTAATLVGTWQTGTGKGFGGSYRFVPTTSTGSSATWTFTGLTSGATYSLAATWPAVVGASSIYYTVSDDHGVLSSRVLAQSALGIVTLLLVVPLWSAILHQLGGVILLAAVTVHAQRLTVGSSGQVAARA